MYVMYVGGMQVRVARIFNTFGPRMHPNDGRVVSNFIIQVGRKGKMTYIQPHIPSLHHHHADIHTYIHIYIHTYMHTYLPTYLYTYIHTYRLCKARILPFMEMDIKPALSNLLMI